MKKLSVLLLALLLAGCALAQPERTPPDGSGDRFAGFYVVLDRDGDRSGFYDNPNLTDYGSGAVEIDGIGSIDIPRKILEAVDTGTTYIFPGMEDGFSLFVVKKEEEWGPVTEVISNMGPNDEGTSIVDSDTGNFTTFGGTIYCGPPLADPDGVSSSGHWTAYRVFQKRDGSVYLDGSGNGFSSIGGCKFSETHDYTETVNGEASAETIKATVSVEAVPLLERLTVTQFDGDNAALSAQDAPLTENPKLNWATNAVWALVEEVSAEGVERAVYSRPEADGEPVSHSFVLLDEEGLGTFTSLRIE